jgi:hypothetical protein
MEHAYLVARGVRPLAIAEHFFVAETDVLMVATRVERYSESGVIPWVLDHGNGTGSCGYASERWPLDLYEWAVRCAPEEQRERIIGLLLGYSARAIAVFDANATGRRFSSSPVPASTSRLSGSPSTAGTSRLCSTRSASRGSRSCRCPRLHRCLRWMACVFPPLVGCRAILFDARIRVLRTAAA